MQIIYVERCLANEQANDVRYTAESMRFVSDSC